MKWVSILLLLISFSILFFFLPDEKPTSREDSLKFKRELKYNKNRKKKEMRFRGHKQNHLILLKRGRIESETCSLILES